MECDEEMKGGREERWEGEIRYERLRKIKVIIIRVEE